MSKTGNAAQLSELIQQRTERDRQQTEAQTSEQLSLHAQSLTQLSNAALDTTKSVIESRHKAMAASLNSTKKQIEAQQQTLQDEIEKQTKRLLWLLKMPVLAAILAALAVCLVLCLGTWAYWRLAAPYKTVTTDSGHTWQVMNGDGWRMCQGQPCRPMSSD